METRKELESALKGARYRLARTLEWFEGSMEGYFIHLQKDELVPLKYVYEQLKGRHITLLDAIDISGERLYERDDTGAFKECPYRAITVMRMRQNEVLKRKDICNCLLSAINYRGDGEEVPAFAKPKLDSIFRYMASIGYRLN